MSWTPESKWTSQFNLRRNIIEAENPQHPVSVPTESFSRLIQSLAVDDPETTLFVQQDGSSYSRKQVFDLSSKFACAALSIGCQRYDAVNVMGFNSLEWAIADLGAILFGGVCAGIYTTNSTETCRHIIRHSGARIIVADVVHLSKLLEASRQIEEVKAIVVWDLEGELPPDTPKHVYRFDEFLKLGEKLDPQVLQDRIQEQQPEDCCSLVYTSGTTGDPKAVMISQDNVVFVVRAMQHTASITSEDVLISFLPFSHIAANLIDVKGPYIIGHTIHFADKQALKGSLIKTMQAVRPTVFLAVPRVWEKIMAKMREAGQTSGAVVQTIAQWAKAVGTAAMNAEDKGESAPFLLTVAKTLVFGPIRNKLGLDRCRYMVTSTAPINESTVEYFRSLHMRIFDLYGNSETTGPTTLNRPELFMLGTVGTAVTGMDLELRSVTASGEGEICVRGRGVFLGYFKDPENSAKSIDADGFYHTGDLGTVDEQGFVRITGRIKELLITSGGENVAPVPIERAILDETPGVDRVVVLGDRRKFLSCLIVLSCESPASSELVGAARRVSALSTTVAQAQSDPVWAEHIADGLKRANTRAVSNATRVQKYVILDHDFSVETGELTETMKLRRQIVTKKFQREIDSMYDED